MSNKPININIEQLIGKLQIKVVPKSTVNESDELFVDLEALHSGIVKTVQSAVIEGLSNTSIVSSKDEVKEICNQEMSAIFADLNKNLDY